MTYKPMPSPEDTPKASVLPPPLAYTVAQTADLLQVSEKTVRRMLDEGQLHGVRAGRNWRIPASALDDYLAGK